MDLAYSDDQTLFRNSVAEVLAGMAHDEGSDAARWRTFASLGWLALPFPEETGGLSLGAVDLAILTEGFGRFDIRSAYHMSIVLSGGLITALGLPAQRETWLPRLADGSVRIGLAYDGEAFEDPELDGVAAVRVADAEWRLNGRRTHVRDVDDAEAIIVPARLAGETGAIGFFLISSDAPGVTIQTNPAADGGRIGTLQLAGVAVGGSALLGGRAAVAETVAKVIDRAIVASCSELVGSMDALFAATRDYTAQRIQFGKPIAANQVIRHRLVDMAVACEEARAITLRAAILSAEDDPRFSSAAAGAKAKLYPAARALAEEAIQLHGAMGVTEELAIGRRLKRILALQASFGTPAFHLDRHARLRTAAPA